MGNHKQKPQDKKSILSVESGDEPRTDWRSIYVASALSFVGKSRNENIGLKVTTTLIFRISPVLALLLCIMALFTNGKVFVIFSRPSLTQTSYFSSTPRLLNNSSVTLSQFIPSVKSSHPPPSDIGRIRSGRCDFPSMWDSSSCSWGMPSTSDSNWYHSQGNI